MLNCSDVFWNQQEVHIIVWPSPSSPSYIPLEAFLFLWKCQRGAGSSSLNCAANYRMGISGRVFHKMTKAIRGEDGVNAPDSGAVEEGEALLPLLSLPAPPGQSKLLSCCPECSAEPGIAQDLPRPAQSGGLHGCQQRILPHRRVLLLCSNRSHLPH